METDSLGKDQPTLGQCRILLEPYAQHTLFSLIMLMVRFVVFSVSLSVMHGTDMLILRKPIFFLNFFSHKILWELMLLEFLFWKYQLSLQTLGTVLIEC